MNDLPSSPGPSPYAPPPGNDPYANPYAGAQSAPSPSPESPPGPGDNPFASPPANPYAPPAAVQYSDAELSFEDPGNFWLGFLAGFFFALLGLIIVYVRGKSESKRGAAWGFGARFGLGLLVGIGSALLS